MATPFQIINGTSLSELCDYSFGDHMGANSIPVPKKGFAKPANAYNQEFINICKQFINKPMTLFIDNIRLYNRPIQAEERDADYVLNLLIENDLLLLCSLLPHNRFIIFTSHEDTPIDKYINIPPNVLGIHAVNAEYFGDRIHPFPYGLQRELGDDDNRLQIMKEEVEKDNMDFSVIPNKLLYINCGIERHPDRAYLVNFQDKPWATCRFDKDSKFFPYDRYLDFLDELRDHRFMVCPRGHGMDCHRNWESLYLRRVPIMKKSPYFIRLMEGFPVLFVDEWSDITPELLEKSEYLFEDAQKMDLNNLDLNLIFKSIIAKYG